MEPGMKYEDMKKVIVIAILDYTLIDVPEYVTETVRVSAEHRDYEVNNVIKYYYVELEKFRNQNPDMSKPINQWLAFLDMERSELLEMAKKESKRISKAVENYEVLTGDEEVKRLAEVKLMGDLEEQSALATARARGTEIGEKIGREQGERIGQAKKSKEIAQELLKINMPIEQIEKVTKLTRKEIEELTNDKLT